MIVFHIHNGVKNASVLGEQAMKSQGSRELQKETHGLV